MIQRSSRDSRQQLLALARDTHAGYFTAKEAARFGYGYSHLNYHVKVGNIERVGHGLYRFTGLEVSKHDDLVQLMLWSRDRADRPQAVVSHATALVVYDLSDLLPAIHLTVPPGFQKKAPLGCYLHSARLAESEIEEQGGFFVTKPMRTLLDSVMSPHVPLDQFDLALQQALDRGLVGRDELVEAAEHSPARDELARALKRIDQDRGA